MIMCTVVRLQLELTKRVKMKILEQKKIQRRVYTEGKRTRKRYQSKINTQVWFYGGKIVAFSRTTYVVGKYNVEEK